MNEYKTARLNICKNCVECRFKEVSRVNVARARQSGKSNFYIRFLEVFVNSYKDALGRLHMSGQEGVKWQNPIHGGDDPCDGCEYVLEHVMFGQHP